MHPQRQTEWGIRVALDFFFGGAGAGLLCVYLLFSGWVNRYAGLSWQVLCIAGCLVLLGLLLLASELGRPANLWQSVINYKSSWIARGAIFNLGLLVSVFLLIVALRAGLEAVIPILAAVTVVLSALVACYPGFLLFSMKDVRLWRSPLLPALMASYSVMSGLSLLALTDHLLVLNLGAALYPVSLAAMILVCALCGAYLGNTRLLKVGKTKTHFSVGVVCIGLLLPLLCYADIVLFALRAPEIPLIVATCSFLIGAFILRYSILVAASHGAIGFLAEVHG